MTEVEIGKTAELPPGTMMGVEIKGAYYLLANVDGEYYAMDGICSHLAGRLWEGALSGHVVKCPRHGSRFDLRTGEVVGQPRIPLIGKAKPLRTYKVAARDGALFISV